MSDEYTKAVEAVARQIDELHQAFKSPHEISVGAMRWHRIGKAADDHAANGVRREFGERMDWSFHGLPVKLDHEAPEAEMRVYAKGGPDARGAVRNPDFWPIPAA